MKPQTLASLVEEFERRFLLLFTANLIFMMIITCMLSTAVTTWQQELDHLKQAFDFVNNRIDTM